MEISADELRALMEERYLKLEDRLEQFEKQLAILTMGYAEVSSLVEAIISNIVNESDEKKRKEWNQHVKESRKTMMDSLLYAAHNVEQSSDKFIAHSTGTVEGPSGSNNS